MVSNLYIYTYNSLSKSAANLSNELQIPRIRHEKSRFVGGTHKVVINWGAYGVSEEISKCQIINKPEAICAAANKLNFFSRLEGSDLTPPFTINISFVKAWLKAGIWVVARELLSSSCGKGIILLKPNNKIPYAPLYVKYIKKQDEYRVHIIGNKIIDIQQKRRRESFENPNWQIRNHKNGFIYSREHCQPPNCVSEVALKTFNEFDLDFGAIDIIYNVNLDRAFALEINTAPGLEGKTITSYAEGLMEYLS